MSGRVVVPGGVPIRRRVAAAHVSARQADPQVHPLAADAKAVFTAVGARVHGMYLIQVSAAGSWTWAEDNLIVARHNALFDPACVTSVLP